jgi:6-phosphogluconate dehydrogenase
MGANMVRRLLRDGHECHVYDVSPDAVAGLEQEGAHGAGSLKELVAGLAAPRAVWLMLPAAITGATVTDLLDLLSPGDAIVDGGNSSYRDDIDRAGVASGRDVDYVDCGTSGGVWGLERGYCLMVGGPDRAVDRLTPVFATLAPGVDAAPRTPGRTGDPTPAEQGWLHCGPSGAGHFVKMVHNGIEYALMAAYAEGLNIIKGAGAGARPQEADAETAPLRDPQYYPYDAIDLAEVAEVWRRAAWSVRGCSTSPPRRCVPTRGSSSSPAASPTPARAGGRRSPRSRRGCRLPCSPPPSTAASPHAAASCSRTRCSRRSGWSSGVTSRSPIRE